jgi:hypothetical protein
MTDRKSLAPRYVPLGLGITMGALVLLAVLQGTSGGSTAIVAPSQYGGSTSSTPYGGLGALGLGVLIAAIAVAVLAILFLVLRRRRPPESSGSSSEEESESGEGTGADEAAAGAGAGAAGGYSEDDGSAGKDTSYDEGQPESEDLDQTLGELDKLADTANTNPPE